jgi:hypothetical protein
MNEDGPFTEVRIDANTLAGNDPMAAIDPVWWIADIYEGPEKYERSLQGFSAPQRFVHAMCWYDAEVRNGGHDQFYSNSTGIVWRDALKGFDAAGLLEVAAILEESARRFGEPPSLHRDKRNLQLDLLAQGFDDLDDAYYALDCARLDERIMAYVRAQAEAFYFHGWVRKPP